MYSIYAYFNLTDTEPGLVYSPDQVENGYLITAGTFSVKVDSAGDASFTIPSIHPRYRDFKKIQTMVVIKDGDKIVWYGRVFDIKRDFRFNRTITCEGAMTFLNDICLAPYKYWVENPNKKAPEDPEYIVEPKTKTGHLGYIMDFYNHRCHGARKMEVITTISDMDVYNNIEGCSAYNTVLNEIQSNIIEDYNYSMVTQYSVDEITKRIVPRIVIAKLPIGTCTQTIEFGKNLIDFEEYISAENIYNTIIPLGSGDISLFDDNGMDPLESPLALKDRAYYYGGGVESACGTIDKVVNFSNIEKREDLNSAAVEVLNMRGGETVSEFSIKAVDLHLLDVNTEEFKIGYNVRVVSVPHSIDEYFVCTEMQIDMLHPDANSYTFSKPTKLSPEAMTDKWYSLEYRFNEKLTQKVTYGKNNGILQINDNNIAFSLLL